MFDIKKKAEELVSLMTLEEKVGQMLHGAAEVKRLNIPSYNWWNEALHGVARAGVATMFPQAIALAATFDEEILYETASIISTEGRAKYTAFQEENDRDIFKGLTYWSPNINIFRDPRWGRGHETYGEDPYLTSRLGVAFIKGLQGSDRNRLKTAACAKHFAVHSGPESERHEFDAVCSLYDLWNTYLSAFEAAVKEGQVEAVMGAYNRTLGEPCCGSKLLLKDILRDKWGFDGHVVSDCWAIRDFHLNHKVTNSPEESVALAVGNGCDINCGNMYGYCLLAVKEGRLTEEQIDTSVKRLFVTRMRLGLLGAPEVQEYINIQYDMCDSDEHNAYNLKVAKQSIVMLKNDGLLPLDIKKINTIGVIGPNADSRKCLEGNYEGTASRHITVLEGIQNQAQESGARVLYAEGCQLYKTSRSGMSLPDDRVSEARAVAKRSDVVVVCLGLTSELEGEESHQSNEFTGGDKQGLDLPGRQQNLLEQVVDAVEGKPVVLVLISGSALAVNWAQENVGGIFQAFYPGSLGGQAIAEAIFGEFSPSGKLPVTFYKSDSDLPDFRDYSMENRTYRYFKGEPLYPFGFGLGYSTFSIADAHVKNNEVIATVKNEGDMDAYEVIQIYIKSTGQKETHNLCGFKRVFLKSKGKAEIKIKLDSKAYLRYDDEGNLVKIYGRHTLFVGFCQPDKRSTELYGFSPIEISLDITD